MSKVIVITGAGSGLGPVRTGGFAILNFASREAAIEGCKQFLQIAGDGTVEMRQILEFAPQMA